ncbi:arsenate reductase/protein-tyrosine-phosphatase family protein [Grimontia sp. NTOU-MAR1]|uniref:arsenate reductase/protein-tyrosine-phosphatase family protein n=1 Tax=Grimontia sp. NTOU-MAR1 TaxID=3111011 RepID=UPI002DB81EA0|nr:hypothetical protein [Grimontia sp. NTOU-MAR1]WRW00998.1 hypothetical protein VP504_21380 [Grimontia sp. NTOU-MAR1]
MSSPSILFICTGNTCRSPMAAAIAKDYCKRKNYKIKILSAGTRTYPGREITKEAELALRFLEIPFFGHKSDILKVAHLEQASKVYYMDNSHREVVDSILPQLKGNMLIGKADFELLNDPFEIIDPYEMGYSEYVRIAILLNSLVVKKIEEYISEMHVKIESK